MFCSKFVVAIAQKLVAQIHELINMQSQRSMNTRLWQGPPLKAQSYINHLALELLQLHF